MALRKRLARLDAALATRLGSIREDETRRRAALVAAVVVGFSLAWVHWIGLVIAGALIGLTRSGLTRAVVAGLGFGVLATLATVATGLVLPAWGALVRGVL